MYRCFLNTTQCIAELVSKPVHHLVNTHVVYHKNTSINHDFFFFWVISATSDHWVAGNKVYLLGSCVFLHVKICAFFTHGVFNVDS